MLIYKHEHPQEVEEILDLQKIPDIKFTEDFDVLGVEGDNFQSMMALLSCYKNSIKLCYADVPYNTGGQDFIYNDKFVSSDSINRHSSWISWMLPRLLIVRELLTENGIMVISIDENERKNLEDLCGWVFGQNNVLSLVTVVSNKGGGGRRNKKDLTTTNEYLVICAKNIDFLEWGKGVFNYNKKNESKPRSVVAYNQRLVLNRTTQFFPFLVDRKTGEVSSIEREEYLELVTYIKNVTLDYRKTEPHKKSKEYDSDLHSLIEKKVLEVEKKYNDHYKVIFPKYDGKWGRWVPSYDNVIEKKGVYSTLYEKDNQVYYIEEIKDFLPMKTILNNDHYSNSFATKSLKDLYGEKNFDTPKSPILMRDIITSFTDDGDMILDWCAGSNSTYHGLYLADELQNNSRKYIYIQKNENQNSIFEEHSKKRVDFVNSKANHITTKTELIDVEDFFSNDDTNCNKEDYIVNLEKTLNLYKRMVEKSKKYYEIQ
jgi:adenine-specific DNA-methyltransferase